MMGTSIKIPLVVHLRERSSEIEHGLSQFLVLSEMAIEIAR